MPEMDVEPGIADYIVISAGQRRDQGISFNDFTSAGLKEFGDGPFSWASVETPLEAVPDAWRLLRTLWSDLEDGARIVVRTSRAHGRLLKRRHLENILRLTGFGLTSLRRLPDGYEYGARKEPLSAQPLSCSVIVPCKNEEANVAPLVDRLPEMGTRTELIFVDGSSTDGTVAAVEDQRRAHPDREIRLLHQRDGHGKAEAVFQGFDAATGDVLMILDADMTVAPEDLPRFYLAVAEGVAQFANGTRFAYPMAPGAMPYANNLGNRAFSALFSWLIGTHVTDTLCGTKAFLRADWPRIERARELFGKHDPWGDFDLLLGARHANLTIVDVPVRYGARTAGESKMRPLRHGPVLARASWAGIRQFKMKPRTQTTGDR